MSLPIITDWRTQMRRTFTSWEKLAAFLELTPLQIEQIALRPRFALKVPYRLAAKMFKGTLEDPLLKQFLPLVKENEESGYVKDPVGDCSGRETSRLLHKYNGRVLLLPSGACAVHCRYCFRQHFDYAQGEGGEWAEEIAYIESEPSITEVILSGGDPLSLSNERLASLIERLAAIPHLRKVRFHTRFPVAIPERIDEGFLELVSSCPLQIYFVLHCNHPRELGDDLFFALRPLARLGVVLLNQAVLLRGVNDDLSILKELFATLTDQGVLPYYLHQLDRVAGAAHFEVPESKGLRLIEELMKVLPGYAVPKYVREVAGAASKQPIQRNM